jgi:hypothetical protein
MAEPTQMVSERVSEVHITHFWFRVLVRGPIQSSKQSTSRALDMNIRLWKSSASGLFNLLEP